MTYGVVNADLMTTSDGVSSAGLYGFKNRIINGAMQIAQRATSATITAGSTIAAGYSTIDRFYAYSTGANVTAAQVVGSGANKNRFQITGAASVTAVGIGQRIEQLNSYDLAGSTATLSCDLANSLLTTVTWTAYYANTADTFGTLASPTRTQIATGTFTVTSTVTNYNVQISIPSAATTGIEIVFTVGAQTSGTWIIGNVQLEKGSTATSFDYRPYCTELALCQRYYLQQNYTQSNARVGFAIGTGGTGVDGYMIPLPVTMRSSPTVVLSNIGMYDGTSTYTISSYSSVYSTNLVGSGLITASGSITAGKLIQLYFSSSAGYYSASSEL